MSEDQVIIYYKQAGGSQQTLTRGVGIVNIGRGNENDLPILENAISRQHARLHITPSGVLVEDLGSTNGTYLDGIKLVAHQPVPIRQGQVLRIAGWEIGLMPPRPVVVQPLPISERSPNNQPIPRPVNGRKPFSRKEEKFLETFRIVTKRMGNVDVIRAERSPAKLCLSSRNGFGHGNLGLGVGKARGHIDDWFFRVLNHHLHLVALCDLGRKFTGNTTGHDEIDMRQGIQDSHNVPNVLQRSSPSLDVPMVDNVDEIGAVHVITVSASEADGRFALLVIQDDLFRCSLDGPLHPPGRNPERARQRKRQAEDRREAANVSRLLGLLYEGSFGVSRCSGLSEKQCVDSSDSGSVRGAAKTVNGSSPTIPANDRPTRCGRDRPRRSACLGRARVRAACADGGDHA